GPPHGRGVLPSLPPPGVLPVLLFARAPRGRGVAFHAVGKIPRWRPVWLAVPAACGLVWVLAIGPAAALAGFLAAPRAVVALLGGVGPDPARLTPPDTASTSSPRWVPRPFPLALTPAPPLAAAPVSA